MSGRSYVESELEWRRRALKNMEAEIYKLLSAPGDVLLFNDEPELRVGQTILHQGREMTVLGVRAPNWVGMFSLGGGVYYNHSQNNSYGVFLSRVVREEVNV